MRKIQMKKNKFAFAASQEATLSELGECRDLLHWFYVENFLYQEIAERQGITLGTATTKDSDVSVI